jgi:exodeoxyribonuclease-5
MNLNPGQQLAVDLMSKHAKTTGDGKPFFVLKGPAGTGKTFSMKALVNDFKRRTVFTAPTNKAVRVLRETLRSDDYRPECRTIYSLLGLQMLPNGEIKELAKPEDPIDLEDLALVVVDEGSMINTPMLQEHIADAARRHPRLRWIFMGDPYQLPPVGEASSPVWDLPLGAELTQIMRQDNQILKHVAHLREMVAKPFGQLKLVDDNDGEEGVWLTKNLEQAILNQAGGFQKGENKAVAWRNVVVDRLNGMVRQELFAEPVKYPWQPSDRITLLEPASDLNDEPMGSTDEEGAVEKADLAEHPKYEDMVCWRLVMRSDMNSSLTLWVIHPNSLGKYNMRLARLAETARATRRWGEYWDFKDAFHKVRHAYATTAHRAQGSTYQRAFVNYKDILTNPNRGEALRCLYVADSRPKKELYLG